MGRDTLKPVTKGTDLAKQTPAKQRQAEAEGRLLVEHRETKLAQLRTELLNGSDYDRERLLNEVRFYVQNAAMATMEGAKRLLLIKEHEGENFWPLIKSLDIDYRFVQRMLQIAAKFCLGVPAANQAKLADLGRSKLMELIVLDDQDIKELADGATVADGLNLDKVDRMSCSELRKEIRKIKTKAEHDKQTTEKMLSDKDAKINLLDREVRKVRRLTVEEKAEAELELEADILEQLTVGSQALLVEILKFDAITAAAEEQAPNDATLEKIKQTIQWAFQRINQVAIDHEIPVDFAAIVNPAWIK